MENKKNNIDNIEYMLSAHTSAAEGSGIPSAVLIPITEYNGSLHLILTQRSLKMKRQPGDFCFPGDHGELNETPAETAVRETCEEIGVCGENIKILGETDFIVTSYGAYIRPFVGYIDGIKPDEFKINPDEVEKIILIPLSFFINTTPRLSVVELEPKFPPDFPFHLIHGGKDYKWGKALMKEWFYDYEGNIIWGLTARIINNFKSIISI